MVKAKKAAVLARGGDEALGGASFYASSAPRPALKVMDTILNTEAPVVKSKTKKPAKPKTAAQLYAENECDAMMISSGIGNQSKLAIKTCKDDALAAFKRGELEQAIIDKYTEQEQRERAEYEEKVAQWNEVHPDEKLVISKNGTAVRSQADPQKQKRKDEQLSVKAEKKKNSRPGTTKDLQDISKRAAVNLKKLQAKKKKKGKAKQESDEDDDADMVEDEDDDEDKMSEDESASEPETELSDDEEREEVAPVKSKAKKAPPAVKKNGGKDPSAASANEKEQTAASTARKRKAEGAVESLKQAGSTQSKKKSTKVSATKAKEPGSNEEQEPAPKLSKPKSKELMSAVAKDAKAVKKPARAGKQTRASAREQQPMAEKEQQVQPTKKKAAKKDAAKEPDCVSEEDEAPNKSGLSRVRNQRSVKKPLGPTLPNPSPSKSNSGYTGNYGVTSDDE